MEDVLGVIAAVFGALPRPHPLTRNPGHCCECAEHEATLQAHTPSTIGWAELGNAGWDPICGVTDEAYRYFMPAFARLALGRPPEYYLGQFLFHLANRTAALRGEERRAVLGLLEHVYATLRDVVVGTAFDLQYLENAIVELMEEPPAEC